MGGVKAHEFEQIDVRTGPDELIDIPILHPPGHHYESSLVHRHSQEWQHVRMVERSPPYHLLTEPLHGTRQSAIMHNQNNTQTTYPSNLVKVTCQVHPQNLGRYLLALVIAHPHIRISPTTLWHFQPVVAKWDLEGSGE